MAACALLAAIAIGCGVEPRAQKSVEEIQAEQMAKLRANEDRRIERARSHGSGAHAHAATDASAPQAGDFLWPDPDSERDVAVVRVADLGDIYVALYPEIAPRTVEHFERLVNEGFYDGITFHRVVPGFVVQAGDPLTRDRDPRNDGRGGSERRVPDEFSDAPHVRGVVSLANRGTVGTADSQFFITLRDQPDLDGRFTVFGRVVAGMDVADAVARVEIDRFGRYGPANRPIEDVVMERVRIERAVPSDLARADAERRGHEVAVPAGDPVPAS